MSTTLSNNQISHVTALADDTGLVAHGLGKRFKKRPVVRNVSLSVRRGEAVGLLGPNGAGKTTTFYMIIGLIGPDTGTIELDGEEISNLPMYRRARLGHRLSAAGGRDLPRPDCRAEHRRRSKWWSRMPTSARRC